MVKVYIPRDTTAVAMGADELCQSLQQQCGDSSIELIRNGSRGLFWLEPMVEVETSAGRIAYGPVTVEDLPSLLESGLLEGEQAHPLCQGLTEEIPYLKRQQRLTFARAGITDPVSLDDYQQHGGLTGLKKP